MRRARDGRTQRNAKVRKPSRQSILSSIPLRKKISFVFVTGLKARAIVDMMEGLGRTGLGVVALLLALSAVALLGLPSVAEGFARGSRG